MKTTWIYWGSTGLLALAYLAGGVMYLTNIAGIQQAFGTLGYPGYLVPILGVVKLAAAVTILWRFNIALTDLAYAGMFFHLMLAMSAHLSVGDGGFVPALVILALLLMSFFTQNIARKTASPYGVISRSAPASMQSAHH